MTILIKRGWKQKSIGDGRREQCIMFLNGIKTDVQLENVMVMDGKVQARMNQSGLNGLQH